MLARHRLRLVLARPPAQWYRRARLDPSERSQQREILRRVSCGATAGKLAMAARRARGGGLVARRRESLQRRLTAEVTASPAVEAQGRRRWANSLWRPGGEASSRQRWQWRLVVLVAGKLTAEAQGRQQWRLVCASGGARRLARGERSDGMRDKRRGKIRS